MHYLIVLAYGNRALTCLNYFNLSPCSCVNFEKRYVNHEVQVKLVKQIEQGQYWSLMVWYWKDPQRQVLFSYDKERVQILATWSYLHQHWHDLGISWIIFWPPTSNNMTVTYWSGELYIYLSGFTLSSCLVAITRKIDSLTSKRTSEFQNRVVEEVSDAQESV